MRPYLYPIIILLIICWKPLQSKAQSYTLSGKVMKADGSPLAGATLQIKGTNLASGTSEEGTFRINSRATSGILEISYIGYLPQSISFKLPLKNPLSITLIPDALQLQEITVSTGYQEISKERATGSYEYLSTELLNRSVSPEILDRIEGLSPATFFDKRSYNINGSVNSNDNLLIRGLNSINANTRPLIVLDDFPYEGDISSINPNDIESISILKDASAASIWGARAGNGVIVIKTKEGSLNQPLRLSFNSNVSITEKPDLFAYPQLSSADYIATEQYLFSRGYYNSMENSVRKPALSPVVELLIAEREGQLSSAAVQEQLNAYKTMDSRQDFLDLAYREALSQQYALNLQGGSAKHSYYLSAGYDKKLQTLQSNDQDRLTLRAEQNLKPLKNLDIGAGMLYSNSRLNRNASSTGIGYGQIRTGNRELYPYARLVDETGNPASIDKDFRSSFVSTLGNGLLQDWYYRPLQEAAETGSRNRSNDLLLNTHVKYRFFPWMNAEIRYQYQQVRQTEDEHYGPNSYYTRNLINRFSQISGTQLTRNIPLGGILDQYSGTTGSSSVRGQLNFSHILKGKHELSGLAGAERRQVQTRGSSYRSYGYDENILTIGQVDYTTAYPGFNNLSASSTIPNQNSFSGLLDRYVSLYANAGYSYDRKYTLSMSARKDASNLFGVKTNQKGVPLWSVGGAWNIHEENFFNLKAIPVLKLRSSYGYAGNVDNGRSALSTIRYSTGLSTVNRLPFATVENPPNEQLRWEKVRTWNTGIDFATKGNRISGSIDYYTKKTTDLLGSEPADPTSGFSTTILNGASTKARGVELLLNTRNISGKWNWDTNILLAYNQTKVERYLSPATLASAITGTGSSINPIEGYPVYPLFSYRWGKLDETNGDPVGYIAGAESKDYAAIVRNTPIEELVFHGSAIPLYNGAIRNTLSWNKISLSANITFRMRYYFRRASINYGTLYASGGGHPDYTMRWQQAGDEESTQVPSQIYPANTNRDAFYNDSELTVEKGDHIRLQDVRLAYDIDNKTKTKLPFKSMQFYIYGSNLGILWRANKLGIDPDYGYNNIPLPASIALGLRGSF